MRKEQEVDVVHLAGRITIGKGDVALRDKLEELFAAGSRRLLLNLTEVTYLDSAGVGEIVACSKRAADCGAVMKIVMLATGAVRDVFVITCLDRVFEIHTDEDAALASFSP